MRSNLKSKLAAKWLAPALVAALGVGAQLNVQAQSSFFQNVGDEASVSAVIVNLQSKDTLLCLHPRTRVVPASVMKLLTTATAVELLGPDFRYSTKVYAVGDIRGSVLHGDVWVIGGGDPSFCSVYYEGNRNEVVFEAIMSALKSNGIRSVTGSLCVDDGYFNDVKYPPTRLWEDMGNYYGAIPSSLNYLDNSLSVYLQSPKLPDQPCDIVRTYPEITNVKLVCNVKSSLVNRDSVYVFGVSGMSSWLVDGKMPIGQSSFVVKAALPDPPLCFANNLCDYLRKNAIAIHGECRLGNCPLGRSGTIELASFTSASLPEMMKVTNTFSNNLWADNQFLTIGKRQAHTTGWDVSRTVVRDFWSQRLRSSADIAIADGSGLSPKNLVSSAVIVELLSYMQQSPNFNHYLQSLAKGGETGTLKNLWAAPSVRGRVFAKSGTINGVVAYAGYFKNQSGHWCAFSVIVNNSLKTTQQLRFAIEALVTRYVLAK